MAGQRIRCQSEDTNTIRTSFPVFEILPDVLQAGLQPLVVVRQRLSDYSLRSRRRVSSLVMYRWGSEDADILRADIAANPSGPIDSSEASGICWKFAHHGTILHRDR